ncbi:hypothetical protein V490_09425 [Pseudogymnoascus sp. VKM F-3557]|nr:hypothetical protein V490_09425 [Pseudogymnoascus sp. VKM F-3557]
MVQLWSLTGSALAFSCLQSIKVSASPSINVALATSFTSAPYLLELLETAGDENSTSYFPLLDRIAEGYFKDAKTDLELYNSFVKVLQDDGHLDSEGLSSYGLALSLRTSAPRIEAQYQFYDTAIEPSVDDSCPVWVLFAGEKHCSPALDEASGTYNGRRGTEQLQFDRIIGNLSAPASILYADITSPEFNQFHKTLIQKAQKQEISYRIRHKKPSVLESRPLVISGYGVELALKRTDYIVIDDREAEAQVQEESIKTEVVLEDEELADLKPLSTSELVSLGLKASSFIMQSENPFEVLTRLSQDFPRYSSAVAAHNVSSDFAEEHAYNRGQLVPAGANVVWINGLQVPARQIDAFSMLDILRKERKLLNKFSQLGLTGPQTINLLSHKDVAITKVDGEPARFDWRDSEGDAIMWLNNIEKDKRYSGWPTDVRTLLQGGYPGQLPQVRKDLFNLVFPVDLSNLQDVELVVTQLSGFVKRALPLRFGLVPLTNSNAALEQAKIAYHLLDSYGVSAMVKYLNEFYASKGTPSSRTANFEAAIEERKLLSDKVAQSLEEVLDANEANGSIEHSKQWNARLGANDKVPPVFVNGAAIPRDENWMQGMSQRVQMDLQLMMRAVFDNVVTDDYWPPMLYLDNAAAGRNPFLMPENDKDLQLFDVNAIYSDHAEAFRGLPVVTIDRASLQDDWAHMVLIADVESSQGEQLLKAAAEFSKKNPSVEIVIVPSSKSPEGISKTFEYMDKISFRPLKADGDDLDSLVESVFKPRGNEEREDQVLWDMAMSGRWRAIEALLGSLSLKSGQQGILLNGRLVGPIPRDTELGANELEQLLSFERVKRIRPVLAAVKDLGFSSSISDPLASSKLTSLVALSFISNVPEGIFEQAPTLRINSFKAWKSEFTAIEIGDESTASIHIQVTLDPASQDSQRLIPILKVLSELDGVYLKLFLNPKDMLKEIPVKRFYRYVLESKPLFNADGSLKDTKAQFASVPQEALLTVGMDVPAPWLVAPKQSVTDLDNIKLSSVNGDVNAVYELQHILIEGHSSEKETGQAPRGAQLLLGTAADAHFADTIIMANLGYFQFKANPGFYKINLQEGPSSKIFNIDTLGASGKDAAQQDETTEISLISFQGLTLFPQLSRNPGQETEDVLEPTTDLKDDIVSKGRKLAQNILNFGSGAKKSATAVQTSQAEINIFSVASGHLYERMLNIMMVSVMKHTTHTVKFWFIEQFLSPSFKQSIPSLSAAYGFDYEMVTYKWPHWLRSQPEKQREIWGYKILFLDVLFPLSLDKVIFVDADQIVRTDMRELVDLDLQGAPYGFTPMCDSRTEMEGFRFWKQGYWKNYLRGLPYHISALYVVDLRRFREIAAGDRLRQQYHQLSADPNSLSNLDQDLPNHMQTLLPIFSLPQEWLWCETWCSDESLGVAKTIDLCNNPMTKEPKLDRARRQVPEWTVYDDEIAGVFRAAKEGKVVEKEEEKNTKSRTMEAESTGKVKDEL